MDVINQMSQVTKRPFWKGPKIIFAVLAVILAVEAFFALRILLKPLPPPPAKLQPITGGKIVLVSPKKEYKVGDLVPVSVRVSTGGQPTSGTDLTLQFDAKVLEATGSAALRKGRIYPEYPKLEVDGKAGVIRISGIASSLRSGFNGVGVFATINFKAKSAGSTTLKVDFTQGLTNDSNIVEARASKDILEGTQNLEINVK